MTALVINGDTSGSITLQVPAAAGSGTVHTLPAATGTVMVTGNMPAFSAYGNAYTSITANTWSKINFQVEEFDTNNNFASSRFTPTIAGYYIFSAGVGFVDANGNGSMSLFKNGSSHKYFTYITGSGAAGGFYGTAMAYANGTTDYFEIYVYEAHSQRVAGNQDNGYFQGYMVRAT